MNTSKKLNGFNNGKDLTDGVGGGPSPLGETLTILERALLKSRGINVTTFWTVQYPETKEILAIFQEKQWAEDWRNQYSITSIIEPFEMQIKI